MLTQPPAGIRIKVETIDPATPEDLATWMAESLQGAILKEQDALSRDASVLAERQKANQLQFVEMKLRERQREEKRRARAGEPPLPRRRMEPYAEYVLEDVQAEIRQCRRRALAFEKDAQEFRATAEKLNNDAESYRLRLMAIRERAKGGGPN